MEEGASKEDQRMASSQAEAMRAQYDLALLQAEYAQVRSPASGRVVKVMVEAGNMVASTMPLVVIAQDAAMTAQVAVPERHYGRFLAHRGAIPAFITPIAFSERKPFAGVVASVSQAVDPQSRSFLVEVSVDNSEGLLRSGMYVDVALSLDTAKGALALPERAIIRKSGSTYVYVIGPVPAPAQGKKPKKPAATPDPAVGAVSLVEVKTGLSGDGYVQILSGLAGTESVVVEGNAFLEDGQTVRVVEAE
jgi:RND family efflux transporter MFP subunit